MEKKYNIVLGLMIFFFIVVVGVCLAWGLGIIGFSKDNLENNTNNEQLVSNSNNVSEDTNNVASENASSNEIKNDFISNISLLDISKYKCLNEKYQETNYELIMNDYCGAHAYYENNKLYLRIIDGELYECSEDINVELNKGYEIKNIDVSKVANVVIEGWGNGIDFPVVFFLMKDGTVEWINTFDAFVKNDFNAEGKIVGVKNVNQIIRAGVYGETGGGYTVIGVTANGDFYDLISETVNNQ